MVDGRCSNKKGVDETSGIRWNDKEEDLISHVNMDGRNICKHENNSGA